MSSIAYVADRKMMEYHRLCGNPEINFWRLSPRAGFSDFKTGDLLFFYTYGTRGKKKGFCGYAHYQGTRRMSIDTMWKRYGTRNGYDDKKRLRQAILDAARGNQVPETLNCLLLTDCVYFSALIDPRKAGISINEKLESYMYLDKNDPSATVKILRKAEEAGIDTWSKSQTFEPDTIFMLDEVRQILSLIVKEMGSGHYNEREKARIRKLKKPLFEEGYEAIRSSETDLMKMLGNEVNIAIPFVAQSNNRPQRVKEVLGKMQWYRLKAEQLGLRNTLMFTIVMEEQEEQKEFLLRAAQHE